MSTFHGLVPDQCHAPWAVDGEHDWLLGWRRMTRRCRNCRVLERLPITDRELEQQGQRNLLEET